MDWKLGVSVSSSSCRSLNSPHVSLLLKVADPGGNTQQHTAEMSVPEFQVGLRFFFFFFWLNIASYLVDTRVHQGIDCPNHVM